MTGTQQTTAAYPRNRPVVIILVLVIVVALIAGALYVLFGSNGAAPAFPATPPGARPLGASQVTPELGSNQIVSTALYRVPAPPSAVVRFYRRTLPGHGGTTGRFATIITSRAITDVPTALQHVPRAFIDGTGVTPSIAPDKDTTPARYTYTEYATTATDVGVAIDLHHPRGPTLVYVEMLSD